jgi:hypothetical protein
MSGMLNLPDTFRGPEYQKLFTIFRNQPNQNFNLLIETILKKQKGKIDSGEFMSNIVFYILVPQIIMGVISRKRIQEDPKEFAADILDGALNGLLYIGNITSFIASGFMGATTPLDSLIEDIYWAAMAKDPMKKLDHVTEIISKATGFPYLGIKRIVTGEPFGKPAKSEDEELSTI